jgi:8-amino-7-oxononanoate synthase
MIILQQKPGRITFINNEAYLFFSGYSYLGLGCNETFLQLVKEGMDLYGVVYPSSRISNTPLDLFERFETKLASHTKTEAAASFSSGFLAARTAVETVSTEMNVYSLAHTHPASAALPVVKPIEAHSWEQFLELREKENEFNFAIAADSIYPTPGHINDFDFLQSTPPYFKITLVLDDSHGIGWMGTEGQGILSKLQLPNHVELLLNFSLSKSYHINAGAVCGSKKWISKLKQHVNYTSSTPVMPALAHTWLNASSIFQSQRIKLHKNIEYLQNLISDFKFASNESTPVFTVNRKGIAPYLLQNRVIISSFGYPHPENDPVNRIVVNALHETEDLEKITGLLKKF